MENNVLIVCRGSTFLRILQIKENDFITNDSARSGNRRVDFPVTIADCIEIRCAESRPPLPEDSGTPCTTRQC